MATVQQRFLEKSFNNQTNSPQNSTSNIPYMLFVYRDQLRRLNKHALKLSKSKLHLTQELVSYSVDRITEYDMEELININREISYTRKLKSHMDHMRQMQKMRTMQAQLVK